MSISRWPSAERPREKLILRGPAALSDAELLAIILRTGVAGSSAIDLGRQLLHEFGSAGVAVSSSTYCCRPH
jgi:DNA repair protein RadC